MTLDAMTKHKENVAVVASCLRVLIALMTKQPDLLDKRGIEVIVDLSKGSRDEEVLKELFAWVKECCTMHESNR